MRCLSVGLIFEDMLTVVQRIRSNLAILIKNGQFDDLKKRLYNDFCDIP